MMISITLLIHYLIISITIGIPLLSVARGQQRASMMVINALDEQPSAQGSLRFLFLLGAAMLEFAGILSIVMSIIFFYTIPTTLPGALAQLGAAAAFTFPAATVGTIAAYSLAENIQALARQPLLQQKIMRLLLLTQIMLQTPVLFGFVLGGLLNASVDSTLTITAGIKLFASGLTFGLGCMGPLLGLSLFARQACSAVGEHPQSFDNIFAFSFVSQGIIETPILFVFVVSLWLWLVQPSEALLANIVYITIACMMSSTVFGAGISSGTTAGTTCKQIGLYGENYAALSRTSLLGQVFIETNAIYGFIIAFIMLYLIP